MGTTGRGPVMQKEGGFPITASHMTSIVKAMVFLVVMYGCECWTIKKAEC